MGTSERITCAVVTEIGVYYFLTFLLTHFRQQRGSSLSKGATNTYEGLSFLTAIHLDNHFVLYRSKFGLLHHLIACRRGFPDTDVAILGTSL